MGGGSFKNGGEREVIPFDLLFIKTIELLTLICCTVIYW